MLIDLHTHSYPISSCARATFAEIIEHSRAAGLDGIVIANHYQRKSVVKFEVTPEQFAKDYVNEFKAAKAYADETGFKVIFGVEITADAFPLCHLLVYGVPFEFLYENPEIYAFSQKEIYRIVKEYGGTLIQAHPYRQDTDMLDINYLDGVEINCHPGCETTYSREILEIAKKHSLHVTCGSDYHGKLRRPRCGMVIPDDITDTFGLKDYILSENEKTLLVHEQSEEEPEYIKVQK